MVPSVSSGVSVPRRDSQLPQCGGVQDQHDSLIAELSRAGDASRLRERILQGAHDDLSLSEYSIDREAHGVCFFTKNQDVKACFTLIIHLKDSGQAKQRKNSAAIRDDFIVFQ